MTHIQRLARWLIPGLAVAIVLAAAVGTASARNLSISNQSFRVTWSSLELTNNVSTTTMRCPVTLEGSFHARTLAKSLGSLVGFITRAVIRNESCTNGRATILTEALPWHLTYQGFTGTLPNIATIRVNLIRFSFQIETGSNTCLAVTTTEEPFTGIMTLGAGREVTGFTADGTRRIRLRNGTGGIFCGLGSGGFSGTGTVTLLGTTTRIQVTLI